MKPILLAVLLMPVFLTAQKNVSSPVSLWAKGAPGEAGKTWVEKDNTKPTDNKIAGRPAIRLTNVGDPTITVYSPAKKKYRCCHDRMPGRWLQYTGY